VRSGLWRGWPAGVAAWTILLVLLLALAADPALAQCRMCRAALESPESARLAFAFRRAILFLLAVPFTTVAVIGLLLAKADRRSRRVAPDRVSDAS
jgi:hypothetical protein